MFLSNISITLILCVGHLLGKSVNESYQSFVPRVVNGWPVKPGQVPYQLAFKVLQSRYKNTYVSFCGGTIIGPDKVLSAAHCFEPGISACQKILGNGKVKDQFLSKVFAVAGNLRNVAKYHSDDTMDDGQWRKLKRMTIHLMYKFPYYDIAVGYTRRPFVFNSNVDYIPYATVYRNYVGKCLVSGYGRLSHKVSSEILMAAHLEIIPVEYCSRLHRRNMKKFVCTSSGLSDVHKGDSGGPLVCTGTNDPAEGSKGVIVGVVSGNKRQSGSFFTRVSSFKKFIEVDRASGVRANVVLLCLLYCGLIF